MTKKSKLYIYTACGAAAGVGPLNVFGPHCDLGPIIGIWGALLWGLARERNASMAKPEAISIATTVLRGVSLAMLGFGLATTALSWTVVGLVPAMSINSCLNATVTYVYGASAVQLLDQQDPNLKARDFAHAMLLLVAGALGLHLGGAGEGPASDA